MPDRTDPLELLRQAADARASAGLGRFLTPRGPGHDGLLDLASNDYLGLCGDERLTAGAVEAAAKWGTGSTGSRLVTGTTALHAELEAQLAEFTGAQAALVFSSGYLANLTVITALAHALSDPPGRVGSGAGNGPADSGPAGDRREDDRREDDRRAGSGRAGVLVVSDARNHASLIDACRLSRARVVVTPHRDARAVRRVLADRDEPAAIVVSDAVFSVDGAVAPVRELHAAARSQHALLVLDEAHAFGVVGPGGRGVAAAAGIAAEPDVIRTVTLSKSLAGQGGAVLGATQVIDTLVDTGRGFIFDTGLAPPCAGAALAALRVIAAEPELGARAQASAARLAAIAAQAGLHTAASGAAVLAVIVGESRRAVLAQRICAEHGVRAGCFRPPSVPAGQACLRLTGRANLTEDDFTAAARALAAVRDHDGS
jgi:8-amino-7-oxononanoate synthase